ncbi:hypothetical protein ANANG_G00261900 [Anguilla anguilla]|uniref:Complement component C9 n=1 Tax=Anguilla anguilla TaxID=7936 RepID=A0A9D3LRZ0_ANGAN|nr:hypothetical protein ANANG_G00261900 [Anguilla anguilla]
MKPMSAVCVTFGILNYIAFVIGDAIPANDDQLTRTAREANGQGAIDCQMGPWSNWSTCDPCSKMQYRSRTVEVFGQFGGLVCNQPLGERRACQTEIACDEIKNPPCSNTEFQCESGTCIKKRLVCNGDNDCGDFSDEDCDDEPRRPCGAKEMELSELARNAGYGISILGSGARANAFNNEFFNGACSRVRDPNTLEFHRTPWNVAVLNYDTRADESYSKEVFETTSTLLKEIMEENKFSISVGLSYKFEPTEIPITSLNVTNAGLSLAYGRKEIIKQVTEHTATKNKSFMRVKGQVQMGTFRMRSRDLRVTDTFLTDVSYLPLEYAKGEYFRFLEDYGTHYAMSGKEGGEYELVYVLNKEYMKTKKVTSRDVQNCFSLDVSVTVQGVPGTEGTASIKPGFCNDLIMKDDGVTDEHALIDKVMTSVRGGTIQTATALKTKIEKTGVMDVDTYVAWAKSLAVAPVVVHSQPEAIQSLIPLNMPHADVKKDNLKRAFEDYIAEYNVCKCQPCQNGGTVTLIDGECLCLCLPQFEGLACQNIKSEELKHHQNTVVQQGNWGCWSSWTSCIGGRKTRTRTCNTKGLTSGTCKGEILDSDYC